MKSIAGLVALAAAGVLVSTSASAAREIPAACQSDAASLCPGMVPGDHKFGRCMKEHEGQVSAGCKEAARAIRKEHGGHRHEQPGMPTPAPTPATTNPAR